MAGLTAVVLMSAWHQAPWQRGPEHLSICGRVFRGPGAAFSADQLRRESDRRLGTVWTWQGRREVWGRHLTVGDAPGCGVGVYLRTGTDRFLGYDLVGGP